MSIGREDLAEAQVAPQSADVSDGPHLPDLLSVERHWLAALAIAVTGHGLGHAALELGGFLSIVALLGGIVAIVGGGVRLRWLLYVALNARNRRDRGPWLRPLDPGLAPVRSQPDPIPADIDSAMVATIVVCVFGLAVLGGIFIPGVVPAIAELAVGAALVAAWWAWIQRG